MPQEAGGSLRHASRFLDDLLAVDVFVDLYRGLARAATGLPLSLHQEARGALPVLLLRRRDRRRGSEHRGVREVDRVGRPADPPQHRGVQPGRLRVHACCSRDSLEARRAEWEADARPAPPAGARRAAAPSESCSASGPPAEVSELLPGLDEPPADAAELRPRWLLAHLLDWHSREDKPSSGGASTGSGRPRRPHRRHRGGGRAVIRGRGRPGQELGGAPLHLRSRPGDEGRGGPDPIDPFARRAALTGDDASPMSRRAIVALDPGAAASSTSSGDLPPRPPPAGADPGRPATQRAAGRPAPPRGHVAAEGLDAAGTHQAACDLLLKRPPRLSGGPATTELVRPQEPASDAVIRVAADLDGGCLAVQGPPGPARRTPPPA